MFLCAQGGAASHAIVGSGGSSGIGDVGLCGGNSGAGDVGDVVVGSAQEVSGFSLAGDLESGGGVSGRGAERSPALPAAQSDGR